MSIPDLTPTQAQLAAILEQTESFLNFLRDAGLIEGEKVPPVPQSTIPYRKAQAVYKWSEWEKNLNPSNAPFGSPPTGLAAGGWPDWQALHYALVDLHALRVELITHWGLAPLVGAKTLRFSVEAIGKPGGGEKAVFIQGEVGPASGTSSVPVRLEKPLDWPRPVPLDWRKQCRYVVKRIGKVMEAQRSLAAQTASARESQAAVKAETVQAETVQAEGHEYVSVSDREFVTAALRALEELIDACNAFHLAGAKHSHAAGVQFAPFQVVKSRVARMTVLATSRLDGLCVKYLRTAPGEWADGLIDVVRDPIRLDKSEDYENSLRGRLYQLSKLKIVLDNDSSAAIQWPAGLGGQTTNHKPGGGGNATSAKGRRVKLGEAPAPLNGGNLGISEERGMSWDPTLTTLRDELTQLVYNEDQIGGLVDDAGIPRGFIKFQQAATPLWHGVLREAHLRGAIPSLCEAV